MFGKDEKRERTFDGSKLLLKNWCFHRRNMGIYTSQNLGGNQFFSPVFLSKHLLNTFQTRFESIFQDIVHILRTNLKGGWIGQILENRAIVSIRNRQSIVFDYKIHLSKFQTEGLFTFPTVMNQKSWNFHQKWR